MKAVIIGATGATGREVVQSLLADDRYTQVVALGRNTLDCSHPKLQQIQIDFNQPQDWQTYCKADVAFACLGTTLKQAGSHNNQYEIDFTYQYVFAQFCKQYEVRHFVLLSSVGANAKSRNFYLQIKGQLEEAVKALNFASTTVVRPAGLIRPNTDRLGEKLGIRLIQLLNSLGLFTAYRSITTKALGEFLARTGTESPNQFRIIQRKEIV